MIEIIAVLLLAGVIGDMARRRGRSPTLFGLLLVLFWFGGEALGGLVGYVWTRDVGSGRYDLLVTYGLALCGAIAGGGLAVLVVHSLGPVDGQWRELASLPARQSRLLGAVVGGIAGGVVGALCVLLLHGGELTGDGLSRTAIGFLTVAFVGSLLGLVSGLRLN